MKKLWKRTNRILGVITVSVLLLTSLLGSVTYADTASIDPDGGRALATVSGRLVNYWGVPFAGVTLDIFKNNESYAFTDTDPTGKFSIALEPGQYSIKKATSIQYNEKNDIEILKFIVISKPFEVNSSGPIDLGDVQTASLAPFNAAVTAGGKKVDNSLPHISLAGENRFQYLAAQDEDPHRIQLFITPGTYDFEFPQQPLSQSVTAEVTIPEQGLTDYQIELPPFANSYHGRILNAEGKAVSAKIEIMNEQSDYVANSVHNNPSTGNFALGWYSNDNITIRVIPDTLKTGNGKIGYVPVTIVIKDPTMTSEHQLGDIAVQEGDLHEGYFIDRYGLHPGIGYQISDLSENVTLLEQYSDNRGFFQFVLPKDSEKHWTLTFNGMNNRIQVPYSQGDSRSSYINIDNGQLSGGLTGHVTANSPDGNPIEYVRASFLKLQANGQADPHSKPKQMMADQQGEYFAALEPGDYKVIFEADGYERGQVDRVKVTDSIGALNHSLQNKALPPSNVFGSIIDAQGKPVANAIVIFSTEDNDPRLRVETRDNARFEASTRDDGTFDILLPEGKFMLKGVVQSEEYDDGKSQTVKLYRLDLPVNPKKSGKIMLGQIQTAPLVPLQGTMSLNGALFVPPSIFIGFSDDRSYYHVDPALSGGLSLQVTPGKYLIIINSTPQSEGKTQEITVPKSGLTSCQIPLTGLPYLFTGKIVNEDGEPVRAGIVILSMNGQWHNDVYTDAETGIFLIGSREKNIQFNIIPVAMLQDYEQTAVYAPVQLNAAVNKGATKDLGQIVVPNGQLYSGMLVKNGKPLKSWNLEVYNTATKQVFAQSGSDDSGIFQVVVPVRDLNHLVLRVDGRSFQFPSTGFDFGKLEIRDGTK